MTRAATTAHDSESADLGKDEFTWEAVVEKYFKLIFSCLMLVQTFVSDLLDLRQIKEGAFTFSSEVFDPNAILQIICDIFNPQAASKGV